ncbi:MAG TPA: glycosyltransferase family A protein [Terriglobales bacterium]|nr:glycosyltransferase family A protein [Terriglobales bacterium]
MKTRPLVSIVTPVYNEAGHIAECIESVLAQTYQNWQYTVVDNCSTDGSGEIAQRYAAKDARITVHRNAEFLRAIPNHNVALRQLQPEAKYCKVVFADDWLFPECVERMVALAEAHPSVGIVSAYALQGSKVLWTGLPYPSSIVSGRELCRKMFLEHCYVLGSATAMLYRAELVRGRDPFFNEGNLHADTETHVALLRDCDFGFVHQVLSYSRDREESLSSFSSDMNTHFSSTLQLLVKYGPDFLAPDELERCTQAHLSMYYQYLGKNVILGRNDAFWMYHRLKMAEAGFPLKRRRVVAGLLSALGEALLNPQHALARLRFRRDANRQAKRQPATSAAPGKVAATTIKEGG